MIANPLVLQYKSTRAFAFFLFIPPRVCDVALSHLFAVSAQEALFLEKEKKDRGPI